MVVFTSLVELSRDDTPIAQPERIGARAGKNASHLRAPTGVLEGGGRRLKKPVCRCKQNARQPGMSAPG
jgi:hypothetical protein